MNEHTVPGITLDEWLMRRAEREILANNTISVRLMHDIKAAGLDPVEIENTIKERLNG